MAYTQTISANVSTSGTLQRAAVV